MVLRFKQKPFTLIIGSWSFDGDRFSCFNAPPSEYCWWLLCFKRQLEGSNKRLQFTIYNCNRVWFFYCWDHDLLIHRWAFEIPIIGNSLVDHFDLLEFVVIRWQTFTDQEEFSLCNLTWWSKTKSLHRCCRSDKCRVLKFFAAWFMQFKPINLGSRFQRNSKQV